MLGQVMQLLPQALRAALLTLPEADVEELRLRAGQHPAVLLAGKTCVLHDQLRITQPELQRIILGASAQSQYAVQDQLRAGFLSMPGGVRIGVCGSAVVQDGMMAGIRDISSLAIRFPHEIRHPPELLLPHLSGSCLLAGAPGSGKTTLLRSCIRALSSAGARVCVVDERLELAGAVHGVPQFELGANTDVLSGCPKREGMFLLLRAMNPQWIAVDEISCPEDVEAIRQISGCGVHLLATIHTDSDLALHSGILGRRLYGLGVFHQILFLDKDRAFRAERIHYAEIDRDYPDSGRFRYGRDWTGRHRETAAGADRGAH